MPDAGRFRPGQRPGATDLNALRDAGRIGTHPNAAVGLEVRMTPGGIAIATAPEADWREDAIRAKHTTAATAPLYGIIELYDAIEGYYGDTLGRCRRPSYSGFARLGVLREGGSENVILWVQHDGICPVLHTGTVSAGDRLGGKGGTYYAQPDKLGPFLVMYEQVAGVAICEITGKRGDNKICNCNAASKDGPYQTIIWGADYTVTETSPGNITVAMA